VVSLLKASPARSECFVLTANDLMEGAVYEVVFSGRVVEITRTGPDGYRATFEVDRVWKGSVSKRFDLYIWELAPEIPGFAVGQHYLAAAQRLVDPRARQGTGLGGTDAVAFTPVQCTGTVSQSAAVVGDLGEGKPPK